MLEKIIAYSVRKPLIVGIGVLALVVFGWRSMQRIPLDAVPDITNNQVQIVTQSPALSAEEVEQFITYPLEMSLTNLPGVEEVRSVSKFGLSIVTVIFSEETPDLVARQLVSEQLVISSKEIPSDLGIPEMMPITTGLGEIYQYVLRVDLRSSTAYSPTELRTLHDWVVKRQLSGIPGVIDISSFGGYVKQFEIRPDPAKLAHFGIGLDAIQRAMESENQNAGGGYYESNAQSFYVRALGRFSSEKDLEKVSIPLAQGSLQLSDVAEVVEGYAVRFGAMTMDGQGEVVGGITLMLKGENAHATVQEVKSRMAQIAETLPEGVYLEPYLDRSALVDRTTATVSKNLLEGGIIVVLVLVLLLGNIRAGLVVASIIPLAMLFALILMNVFGVSANLMSLGAIDFGIVVDGAVIVTEHVLAVMTLGYLGQKMDTDAFQSVIVKSSQEMIKSAVFGVLIILVVFLPIISLVGIEGKMFKPMALTVSYALLGALLLSITYVPAALSLVLSKTPSEEPVFSHRMMTWLMRGYEPLLRAGLRRPRFTLMTAGILLGIAVLGFLRLGSVFIPKLDEGDFAVQMQLKAGTSLGESIRTSTETERQLMAFPQVNHVVSKIGTAEIPTDPMSIEQADIMILLKDPKDWPDPSLTKEALVAAMSDSLQKHVPYGGFEFTQPIQLRFNELISGAKSDVALKIFGPDFETLNQLADEILPLVAQVQGAEDARREQTEGLNQRIVHYDRSLMRQYHVSLRDANQVLQAAFAGSTVSTFYDSDKKFDIVIRYAPNWRNAPDLNQLYVLNEEKQQIPFSLFSQLTYASGPSLISRENSQRRMVVSCNVRGRDVESVVEDIQKATQKVVLPPGYSIQYGGDYEQLQEAKARLGLAVPIALGAIFILLFISFTSMRLATMVFISVPLSAIGGVAALTLRGMPFSISAGIGFIALFGVAVLNGIVMISHMTSKAGDHSLEFIIQRSKQRLRPVVMTALVAALGFVPMALSTGAGAEVQKPIATVVIGGLISATLLTLIVLPVVYYVFGKRSTERKRGRSKPAALLILACFMGPAIHGQSLRSPQSAHAAMAENGYRSALARLNEKQVSLANRLDWVTPVQVTYQRGQLNSIAKQDDFFTVEWMLPSLSSLSALHQLHTYRMQRAKNQHTATQVQMKFALDVAWARMEREAKGLAISQDHFKVADQIGEWMKTRSDLGLIPQRDALNWQVLVEEVHHAVKVHSQEVDRYRAEINRWVGWTDTLAWLPENASPPTLRAPLLDPLQALVLQDGALALQELRGEESLAKNAWLPPVGMGGFRQKMDGVSGFTGLQFSMALPLGPSAYRQTLKQKTIAVEQQEWTMEDMTREWMAQTQRLALNIKNWQPSASEPSVAPTCDVQDLWNLYQAGAMDVYGLWASVEAYYHWLNLEAEHAAMYQQQILEWNYYQTPIE